MSPSKVMAPSAPQPSLERLADPQPLAAIPAAPPAEGGFRPSAVGLAGVCILGVGLAMGIAGLVHVQAARSRMSQRIVGSGEALLQVLEDLIIEDPSLLRSEVLQPLVAQFGRSASFIERISVIDRSLQVVADTDTGHAGQLTDQRGLAELLHRREDRRAEYRREGRRFIRLSRPLYGEYDASTNSHIFGAMALELAMWPVDAEASAQESRILLWLGMVGGLVGWWLLWLIPRRITGPLREVAGAVERLAQGEASPMTEIRGEPAVAAVAAAVAQATERLGRQRRELRQEAETARRGEERVHRGEERFKALAESNVIGIVVAEMSSRLVEANDAFLKLAGYPREALELGELSWTGMTPAEYQPLDEVAVSKLKATGACPPWEKELIRKDGRRVPVLVGVASVGDAKDRYICFVLDLTERRRSEDVLARLAAIVESSEDAIVGMDLDGTIISWNTGAETMYGYGVKEALGRPVSILVPPELAAETAELLEQVKRGEAVAHHETVRLKRSGQRIEVSLTISPIRDAVGWVIGASSIARDITERKQAEEQIRRLNAELEQQLLQVTSVNKELEAFSYSVSHDLRAPLRSIDGFSQALLEDYAAKLDDEGRDYLRRVRDASQHMGQLIDDMLQLARVTRGELKREPVELSAIVRALADELRQRAPQRKVEIVIAEGLTASGDGSLLRSVLQNLMENAWKFTSKAPQARIEFGSEQRDGRLAYFVRDNGAGFDMAQAARLFTAFQRLHPQSDFPGTGIGLATVQRIIHRHGGRIWAEAAVGAGAAFFFTLG